MQERETITFTFMEGIDPLEPSDGGIHNVNDQIYGHYTVEKVDVEDYWDEEDRTEKTTVTLYVSWAHPEVTTHTVTLLRSFG